MSYNCPSQEEFEAYPRLRRLRGFLDEHARTCPKCAERLEVPRYRLIWRRLGAGSKVLAKALLLCLAVLWLCPGWWSHEEQVGSEGRKSTPAPILPTPETAMLAEAPPGVTVNGHKFHGDAASKIVGAFSSSTLYTVRPGDTLSRVAGSTYGRADQGLWEAIVEFNNLSENPQAYEKRYGTELREDNLMAGRVIQLPPKPVLLLITNRVEVANAPTPTGR